MNTLRLQQARGGSLGEYCEARAELIADEAETNSGGGCA